MAAKIITVAQQKGGAGKTTLVAQLAVTWAEQGKNVAVMDIDPQASLTAWHDVRGELQETGKVKPIYLSQVSGWRTSGEVDRLADEYDLVIIDSPPHAETESKIAIRSADLVLIPLQPSPMDLWATRPTIKLADKEGIDWIGMLNRVPPRGKLADDIRAAMKEQDITATKTCLGNRVAFASSMMKGKGVVETQKTSQAAEEIRTLAKELLRKVK